MLLDHVSCGCTCGDELRGDQRGERQQELLQWKLKGAGSVAIVFGLWTRHIQEDINASRLFCHTVKVRLHPLLIQGIDLCGVASQAPDPAPGDRLRSASSHGSAGASSPS